MAEAAAMEDFSQGDISDAADEEGDPIASRISTASAVAELATPPGYAQTDSAAIARLSELARIRAGDQELIAAAPAPGTAVARTSMDSGWYIQIGAVPTEAGALALIEKAQKSLGPVLASLQPVTQEIEHRGETLYRARFAGFEDKDEARATCHKLESKSFACLAVPN
jgi:D-alanyl-D-alanine carboxypeptidase